MISLNRNCERNLHSAKVVWRFLCVLGQKFKHTFKTYKEQRAILESKNLIIDDEHLLDLVLKDYSYYTIINGYKELFLKDSNSENEEFKDGTKLSDLYNAHWIDTTMSNIIFKYTLLVEKRLKSQLSYMIAKNFGVDENRYLREINYGQASYHKGKLSQIVKDINEKKHTDISAIHYFKEEGNLPPWIAAKSISFGNIVNWYQILREPHKDMLVRNMLVSPPNLKPEVLKDYFFRLLQQVYQYRNNSAHGQRSFSIHLNEKYSLLYSHLKAAKLDKYFDGYPKNGLYSIIFSILILLNDRNALNQFFIDLRDLFIVYSDKKFYIYEKSIIELFGFPPNSLNNFGEYIIESHK
ncbi:hypothetical protein HMPREF2680_09150 [Aerococcus mictus]|nr:hypothetical protein HMPREF2680_09150 [Aerococcus mictus]